MRTRILRKCGSDLVPCKSRKPVFKSSIVWPARLLGPIDFEVAKGWEDDRIKLELATCIAKGAGAVLVAETGCRFLRSSRYNEDHDALPSVFEFERLMDLVDGARLATLHHVDTHWTIVRGHQSKRGQMAAGNQGGRPTPKGPGWKKRKLREAGMSYRKIGETLGLAWGTVRDWIKRASD